MKNIILLLVMLCIFNKLDGQSLIDVYKTGEILLEQDETYAVNTNWIDLFDDKDKVIYGNEVGKMKSIAVSANGELFISNYSKYNIYKLDANGNFIKEFGKEGNKGGEFAYRPTLHGILDNKYVFASDHQGRIQFFDLEGKFIKMVKIDYMPLQIIPLKDNKIAIWGHVPYNNDTKYIVSIKDIITGDEKIVDSYFNSLIKLKIITVKDKNGYLYGFSPSGLRDKTIIERTSDGNLIIGHNVKPKINIYTPDGDKIKEINLTQSPAKTTEKDKTEYVNRIKEYLIKKDLYEENKSILNDPSIYPEYFPIFYSIKSDADGNILIFNYSDTDGNSFLVYDKTGNYICKSAIRSDKFKLDINSRFSTFEIHPSGLYAFVSVIDSNTSELKIIRTKLK